VETEERTQPPSIGDEVDPVSAQGLSRRALDQLNRAEQYSRNGEWGKYSEELKKLEETLRSLQRAEAQ
jgi:uncharacterized membrane protein (UPF0182 family)